MWMQATVLTASFQNEESRVADLLVWLLRALPALLRTLFLSQSLVAAERSGPLSDEYGSFIVWQDSLAIEQPV